MRKSRASPARSEGDRRTSQRYSTRSSQSFTNSPARASKRLTAIVDEYNEKNRDSFNLTPLGKTVLNDDTNIEQPRRASWWKKVDNSRDVIEVLENNKPEVINDVLEEIDVEVLSQSQKKDHTADLPDSSDNETINSIVLPQRKLFTQKENVPQKKYEQVAETRETFAKHNKTNADEIINDKVGTKNLFGHGSKRSKPVFPAALLNISPDKTIGNKTKELVAEVKAPPRSLFGNRPGPKRKNVFADFIVSESDEEIPDIEPKRFAFSKRPEPIRRISTASRGTREPSPTMSITTDIEMDDWNMLPSSTMVEHQLEAIVCITPGKKARLSKLSEAKESEAGTGITGNTDNKSEKSKSSIKSNIQEMVDDNNENYEDFNLTYDDNEKETEANKPENENMEINLVEQQEYQKQGEPQKPNHLITEEEQDGETDKPQCVEVEDIITKKNKSGIENKGTEKEDKEVNVEIEEKRNQFDEKVIETDNQYGKTKEPQAIKAKETPSKKNKSVIENINSEKEDKVATAEVEELNQTDEKVNSNILNSADDTKIELDNDDEQKDDVEIDQEIVKGTKEIEENDNDENSASDKEDSKVDDKEQSAIESDAEEQEASAEVEDDNDERIEGDDHAEVEAGEDVDIEANNDDQIESAEDAEHESDDDHEIEVDNDEDNARVDDEVTSDNEKEIGLDDEEGNVEEDDEAGNEEDDEENVEEDDEENVEEVDEEGNVEEVHEEIDEQQNDAEVSENESVIADNLEQSQEQSDQEDEEVNNTQEIEGHVDDSQDVEESEAENNDEEIEQEESEEQINETEEETNNDNIEDNNDNIEDNNDEEDEEEQNQESEIENETESHEEIENTNDNQDSDDNNQQPTESLHESHDTTGRHRNKNGSKTPEAILHEMSNQENSFVVKGRNTSIRKKSILKNFSIRPSMAPPRESTGLSDGTTNSSAEGSGWDSHRTTRKTLRQTFGRDFTPRKSLRALVMEKSAKRQTQIDAANAQLREPQANSTELQENLPQDSGMDFEDNVVESDHEISRRTRQTTLEMYLQKIKNNNMERNKKIEEQVRNSFKPTASRSDFLNRAPYNPIKKRANTKSLQKSLPKKRPLPSIFPLEDLPVELKDDMKYKPPKRFRPSNAPWITKRLYKFLETKLEPKYDYKARVRAEKLVETIYHFAKDTRRYRTAQPPSVIELKKEMARLNIVKTHYDFYNFFHDYMPVEVKVKVVPDIVNEIPLPREGLFSNIVTGD